MTQYVLAVFVGLLHALLPAQAWAQDYDDVNKLIPQFQRVTASQCEAAKRHQASLANTEGTLAKDAAAQRVALACDCQPQEVDAAFQRLRSEYSDKGIPKGAVARAVVQAGTTCVARHLRQVVTTQCRSDDKPPMAVQEREVYCTCMEAGYKGLSDEQIAQGAQQAYARLRQKVRASMDNLPAPVFEPTAVEAVEKACNPVTSK